MHLQDCISDNLSGAIAKQEMTSCPRERYTRGLHCHIVSSSIKHYNITQHHATPNKTFFQVLWEVLGRFGWFCWWFWVVLAAFGWFWLVLAGNYERFAQALALQMETQTAEVKVCAHSFLFYKNLVFPAQAEYSYFSADFWLKAFLYYS